MYRFLFILLFFSGNLFAQEDCGDKFTELSEGCLSQYDDKLSDDVLLFKDMDKKVYWVKNSLDQYAAVLFSSMIYDSEKRECTAYFQTRTFGRGVNDYQGIASIHFDQGFWSSKRFSLNETTRGDDLYLRWDEGQKECVIEPINAKLAEYKKLKIGELPSGNTLLKLGGTLIFALAVFLIAQAIFTDEDKFKAESVLEDDEKDSKKKKSLGIIHKFSYPFYKRYLVPIVAGMKNKKKFREKYRRPLASAGLTQDIKPEEFFAMKLFLIIGFPIVFIALRAFLEETWPLSLVPALSVFGYFYPDIWVSGLAKQRQEEVIQNMPFIVDMLALSVEAGLDFMAAMVRVVEKAPPSALSEEFEVLLKETKIGSSRAEALRNLAWRIDALPISSFCATLIAADSVGASIGPILKTLSGEIRQKRSADAEKKGATAATKILFPMMFSSTYFINVTDICSFRI